MPLVLPKHRAREYETVFILNPDTQNEGIEQIASKLTEVISRLDGKLLRAENWGRRRLAYPVRKQSKGFYVYLRYLGYSDMVLEMERNLRMLEPVLKYLTVKLDEDVDPAARPVKEEEISFLPKADDYQEREILNAPGHESPSSENGEREGDLYEGHGARFAPREAASEAEAAPEEADREEETDEDEE